MCRFQTKLGRIYCHIPAKLRPKPSLVGCIIGFDNPKPNKMCPYIFKPLPDYLLSWFSECSLNSTKLDDSCKKDWPKFFFGQIFWPNFFLTKFFFGQKMFDPNFILTNKSFDPKYFWSKKFFNSIFFKGQNCFLATKQNSAQKKLDIIFHDFGLGFLDLGSRIWDSGSGT